MNLRVGVPFRAGDAVRLNPSRIDRHIRELFSVQGLDKSYVVVAVGPDLVNLKTPRGHVWVRSEQLIAE